MTEKEKMLCGEYYNAASPKLVTERELAHSLCHRYNASPGCTPEKLLMLSSAFGRIGDDCYIEPTFFCDYAYNLCLGDNVYINCGCTVLDCAKVTIGDGAKLGPNVQIYTAGHPLAPQRRQAGEEYALEISIGANVWIGGGSILLPGVSVGADTVVGAGSVVTKNLPSGVVAVGNPCRVLREIVK
ncbi:MAG: sugar O-acetyltransferase [Cyanobacteria bacterium J06635_11]